LQGLDHFLTAGLRQMIGKKSAVPHDHAHRHFSLVRHGPFRRFPCQMSDTSFTRREINTISGSDHSQDAAPPNVGVQLEQNNFFHRRAKQFVHARAKNQYPVDQQGKSNEQPNGKRSARSP
jgi:hypothetical protein